MNIYEQTTKIMKKQKTALQQLIENLNTKYSNSISDHFLDGLMFAINEAQSLLPTEREQIETSYQIGVIDGYNQDAMSPKTYFTDNFQK